MFNRKNIIGVFAAFLILFYQNTIVGLAEELPKSSATKFPDYACMFLGEDKCETMNRKVFKFNGALNKFVVKPVDILWASIMPKYGMDRIRGVYKNIEYPKRLVSSLVQRDFKGSGRETLRFLTNTTLGIGGMFDPAKRYFHLEPVDENMEQALAKCKCNQGRYLVMPFLNGATPRALCGKALDTALNPTCYIGTPVLAMIKLGFTINETNYMQPIADMIESNYADPYDIAKKLYGIENYIKANNLDRPVVIKEQEELFKDNDADKVELVKNETSEEITPVTAVDFDSEKIAYAELLKEGISKESYILKHSKPKADVVLEDYKSQTPVIDAMRTALFNLPGINDSIWTELSVWNRSFAHRIKTSAVNVTPDRNDYKFRYLMQKDKNSPVAIIFPSIGEGIKSYHSVVFAKLFYDLGYSIIIQGSSFQWEFVKSMPEGYIPGKPADDAVQIANITDKILHQLQEKYKCEFKEKVVIGTSFGALTTLFMGSNEYKNGNPLGITKFISINPPIELLYAMKAVDKNNEAWQSNPDNLKERVALTAAKILNLYNKKDDPKFKLDTLPFNDYEAKLITGFIMHQKLSDLIMTIENIPTNKKTEFYDKIHNINYQDYMKKYILKDNILAYDELNYDTSLYSISDYFDNSDNYKIYHTLDDYLVNSQQLNILKKHTGNKSVYLNNGSHLGFLYRPEFIESLQEEIASVFK